MRKFVRTIRYSFVGVFVVGIIGVIQGCSIEREGALFAALLLLLNFCSGTGDDTGTGGLIPQPGVQFADFSSNTPQEFGAPVACNGGAGFGGGTVIPESFPNITGRGLGFTPMVAGGGTGSIDVSINGGRLSITTIGPGSCNTDAGYVTFVGAGANLIDLSAFSTINVRVTSLSGGPITGCMFEITDNASNPGITTAPFDLAVGDNQVSIAGGVNMNAMEIIQFGFCDFGVAGTVVIEPFHIE